MPPALRFDGALMHRQPAVLFAGPGYPTFEFASVVERHTVAVGAGLDCSNAAATPVGDFVRSNQAEILTRWLRAVRDCAPAMRLPEPALTDHLPVVLRRIADAIDHLARGDWSAVTRDAAIEHARTRVAEGFELGDVITEFFLLRQVLLQFALGSRTSPDPAADGQLICWAVDSAIRDCIAEYAIRLSTLRALDSVSQAALESLTAEELFPRLVHTVVATSPAVDVCCMFTVQGDLLVHRVAEGVDARRHDDVIVRHGQGVVGRAAAERMAITVRSAEEDEGGEAQVLRERGFKALLAVPLIASGNLVGVLQMGSLKVTAFSTDDVALLRAVAERMSSAIHQQGLRERAQRLAAERNEAYALLADVYETAPIGLALLDRDLRFVRVNKVLAEINGLPAQEHVGKRIREINVRLEHTDDVEEGWRRVLETGEPWLNVEVTGDTPAAPGSTRIWLASYYPVRAGGEVVGVGIVVDDVTDKRKADDFQRHVVGIVSHDLRAPLSTVSLSAAAMEREDGLSSRQRAAVGRIQSSVVRMDGIIGDLLDYARARGGAGIPIQRRDVDLARVCQDVIDEVMVANPSRTIRFEGPGSLSGRWDAARLAQAVSNLVQNAVKHSPEGTAVEVRLRPVEESVELEVVNEGEAVSPEVLAHIFDPFERGNLPSSSRKPTGTGLGLYIARAIARAHGGELEASAEHGTWRLRLTLPATNPRGSFHGGETRDDSAPNGG